VISSDDAAGHRRCRRAAPKELRVFEPFADLPVGAFMDSPHIYVFTYIHTRRHNTEMQTFDRKS